MFSLKHGDNNLWYGTFSVFPPDRVINAVSTRFNGVSKPPFDGLNLALHVGDEEKCVLENRRLFCEGLGLDAAKMTTCRQVHGNNIACITADDIGAGAFSLSDTVPDTDALITNVKNVPLTLFFADCTPIMIYDPDTHAIGVAHGGWRGTVAAIAFHTVKAMAQAFGTQPHRCLASIGPSIGPCCYEIGDEVAEQFKKVFLDAADLILRRDEQTGRQHLDLWQANALMLHRAGLRAENIDMADTCTCCSSDVFFSYRADGGKTGRIAALMALK